MRLTGKEIQHIKELVKRSKKSCPMSRALCNDMFDTIEALQQENEQYDQDRIAMQQLWGEECEEYIKLQQENEQLQAQVDEWKHESQCHMDIAVEKYKEVERLQAQNGAMVEALKQARMVLKMFNSLGGLGYNRHRWMKEVLRKIAEVLGE